MLAVRIALKLPSPNGDSYGERLDTVRTERELSLIFEDFISMVPLGKRLFGDLNPVRTAGAMQVSAAEFLDPTKLLFLDLTKLGEIDRRHGRQLQPPTT